MDLRFTVLGSGSSGNASVLQSGEMGLLIDFGFGNRQMQSRMDLVGLSWTNIHAAIITHTHGDHWREQTLTKLARYKIPLYCHPQHVAHLTERCAAFSRMKRESLVHHYSCDESFQILPTLSCRAVEVPHDCQATCAFRFEGPPDLFGTTQRIGFATDLGAWHSELVDFFRDVQLLAIESNYDDEMERNSGRPAELIHRVSGVQGHLSNDQSAAFVRAVLNASDDDTLSHIVLMHLSRQCNRQHLAAKNMKQALADIGREAEVIATSQVKPTAVLAVGEVVGKGRRVVRQARRVVEDPDLFAKNEEHG